MQLILASTSPYRKQLLENAGLPFKAIAPEVDEESMKQNGLGPQELAETLAKLKAKAAANILGDEVEKTSVIIGSDQVASLGPQVFNKPGNIENAKETLRQLAGHTHLLITSVCILHPSGTEVFSDITRLSMRPLTERQIESYLQSDEPYNCAGSYKLESAGIKLFEKIDSEDFTAIQGLPMIELCNRIYKLGFKIF